MLTVAQLAWIIAFVGSVIGSLHGEFPNYTWWALVYFFCCIVGVIVVVGSESEDTYHVAVRSPRSLPARFRMPNIGTGLQLPRRWLGFHQLCRQCHRLPE